MAVTGLGRKETCIVHHNRPAVARCGRCHKPVCSECVVSTADGKFCSRECAAKAADFRAAKGKFGKPKRKLAGLIKKVVILIIVVFVLGAVNTHVYRIPVIGGLLDKLPFVGKGEELPSIPGLETPEEPPPAEPTPG